MTESTIGPAAPMKDFARLWNPYSESLSTSLRKIDVSSTEAGTGGIIIFVDVGGLE
jgi:hypothetical protein